MKKLIAILLSCSLLCALASCGGNSDTAQTTDTTQTRETTESSTDLTYIVTPPPADETQVARTLTASSTDGIDMEVTVLGYSSETLGESFYAKGSGPVTVKVKITNNSGKTLYQTLPSYCHGNGHNHEVEVSLADADGKHLRNMDIGICPAMLQSWSLATGESITFTLSYVAGDYCELEEADIKLENAGYPAGIALYKNYTNGACEYSGSIAFSYGFEDSEIPSGTNTQKLSAPLTVRFLER